jgi:hypothetical protein
MDTPPIIECWQEFERNMLPQDFGAEQRRKVKFAFYSGAVLVVDRCLNAAGAQSQEEFLRSMSVELQSLANSIAHDVRSV